MDIRVLNAESSTLGIFGLYFINPIYILALPMGDASQKHKLQNKSSLFEELRISEASVNIYNSCLVFKNAVVSQSHFKQNGGFQTRLPRLLESEEHYEPTF